jgi:hypothetical protein
MYSRNLSAVWRLMTSIFDSCNSLILLKSVQENGTMFNNKNYSSPCVYLSSSPLKFQSMKWSSMANVTLQPPYLLSMSCLYLLLACRTTPLNCADLRLKSRVGLRLSVTYPHRGGNPKPRNSKVVCSAVNWASFFDQVTRHRTDLFTQAYDI